MQETSKAIKVYVPVDVSFDESGTMFPRRIHWLDGHVYSVDRVLDVRPAHAERAGGQGDRYKVRIKSRETYIAQETYIFFEHNADFGSEVLGRWFVERKVV